MPNPSCSPRGAICASLDLSHLVGETLYVVAGDPVIAPPSWAIPFEDAAELVGRGDTQGAFTPSPRAGLMAGIPAAADAHAWIDDEDRVVFAVVRATDPGASLVFATDSGALGFPAGTYPLAASSVPSLWQARAPLTWGRGLREEVSPSIFAGGTSPLFFVPWVVGTVPDLLLDLGTTGDSRDDSLTALDDRVRWSLTDRGHVIRAWQGAHAPTSVHPALRELLGYTGREMIHGHLSHDCLTADLPCAGVLVPPRPLDTVIRGASWRGSAVRLSDGAASISTHDERMAFSVRAYVDGMAGERDLELHWLTRVRPLIPPGGRVTVYQDWGDRRRADFRLWGGGYSTSETPQAMGRYGRIRGRLATDAAGDYYAAWPGRAMRRAPIEMTVTEIEGGQRGGL